VGWSSTAYLTVGHSTVHTIQTWLAYVQLLFNHTSSLQLLSASLGPRKILFCNNGKAFYRTDVFHITQLTRHKASTSTRWYFAFGPCCHSSETRALIANLPNSAQLEGTSYHSPKLHLGLCSSVGMQRGTDRQTHRHRRTWPIYILRRVRLIQKVTISKHWRELEELTANSEYHPLEFIVSWSTN